MRCFRLLCLGFFLAAVFSTQAAQLLISVGTTANDGSGDTIRQAFQKVNTNFTEVYSNIANLNVSGGGSNYLFDVKQFTASSGGTNIAIKAAAAETNIVFYPDASSLVAWAVADSSLVYITNSTGHLLNSSWLFEGTSTLGMDGNAVIFDYPGSSKTWNFKATQNGNTVARISDINGSTNGVAPLSFDGTQFAVSQGTNVAGKSGIQLTNVDANVFTNRGASTLVGAVEARAGLNVAGAGNVGGLLTASNNAAITGTANVSSTLTAGGAIIASNNLQVTGTSTHGGAATFTNAVEAKSTLNVAGAANVSSLTSSNTIVGQAGQNLTGALGVGGTLTASNTVSAQGAVNITGAVGVGGVLSASNNVNVTGTTTHGGVATFTNTMVGQAGENLTGALNVGGAVTLSNSVVANSTANIASSVNVGGILQASNTLVALSTENVTSTLNVGGAIIASNNLQVTGTSTHGGVATFTNTIVGQAGENLTGALGVGGTLTASNTVSAQGAVNITGAVGVGGTLTISNAPIVVRGSSTVLQHTNAAQYGQALVTDGTNATWQTMMRALQQPLLARTASAIASNIPIMLLPHGDSLNSNDQLAEEYLECWIENYGWCGSTGSGAAYTSFLTYPGRYGLANSAGAFYTNNLNRWYTDYLGIPAGDYFQAGQNQYGICSGCSGMTGNVFEVVYIASNNYGGFSVTTNDNFGSGGTFTVLTNIVAHENLGYETNRIWRYTNSGGPVSTIMRITGLSNLTQIISFGIIDTTHPGVIYSMQARPSWNISQLNSVPTNSWGPVFRQWSLWHPMLMTYKSVNGGSAMFTNNFPQWYTALKYYCTNLEFINVEVNPIDSGDQDVVYGNQFVRAYLATNGGLSFPGHWIFKDSFTWGKAQEYLIGSGNVHLTPSGGRYEAHAIWNWQNLTGDRGLYSAQPFPWIGREVTSEVGFKATLSTAANDYSGTGRSNAFEVTLNGSRAGGAFKNGQFYYQPTNTADTLPANYTVALQNGLGSSTNTTTATNSLWGSIGTGNLTLGASVFLNTNRNMSSDLSGDYWTGTTPGQCRFMLTLGANNVLNGTVTPPPSVVGGRWEAHADLLLLTNSSTIGAVRAGGRVTFFYNGGTTNCVLTNTLWFGNTTTNQALGVSSTNGAATDSFLSRGGVVVLQ